MHRKDSSELTRDHLVASLQWISKMSSTERWNLTDDEVASLLELETAEYQDLKYKTSIGELLTVPVATIERISLLLGIAKALSILAPSSGQGIEYDLFNRPNSGPFLKNQSIKNHLLANSATSEFYLLKQHLESFIP